MKEFKGKVAVVTGAASGIGAPSPAQPWHGSDFSFSAAAFNRARLSATPSLSNRLLKRSMTQAHHPGEMVKSQPKLTRVCPQSSGLQVRWLWTVMPKGKCAR